jgi:carbonic anhydrase
MKSLFFSRMILLVVAFSLLTLAIVAQETHPPHWAYTGPENPSTWGKLDQSYAACSLGHTQSPINIIPSKKTDLPGLKLDYKAIPLNIIDNGHTIQINYAPGSTVSVGDKTYTLKQFHFHHPSEEHIDGKIYPLVGHLVHSDDQGHLAVIAILFEEGSANSLIERLWKNIPTDKGKARDVPSVSVNLQEFLPRDLGYFTFTGSLTTPPCSEGVTWYVLQNHPTLSKEQIAMFAKIYPMNARPIQPTNGREILESKSK